MDYNTKIGNSKKIAYSVTTAIVIILAAVTVLLTMTEFLFKTDNADTAHTADKVDTGEASDKRPINTTEAAIESESAAATESEAEHITEPPETEADNNTVSPFVKTLQDIESMYPDTVLTPTEDMGDDYINRIVFLGDSTTYGLKRYGMLPGGKDTNQVWTPVSGTLTLSYATFSTILYPEDGSEIIITEAVQKSKPDILVITLGINGISFMDESYFKSEYTKLILLIQEASPDTKIILQSIFPLAQSYVNKKSINNEKIVAANVWIADIAKNTGVKYANTASVLIGSDGYLPEEYHNGDGLHLNEISFGIELEYLRTHAYPPEAEETSQTNEEADP